MTCCEQPRVRQAKDNRSAVCECGFRWTFGFQKKGKFKAKKETWGTAWYCEDDYERDWRLKGYKQHEVVGTRRRGKIETYVCACPKSGTTFAVSVAEQPSEVYCPSCDRSGLLAPMLMRWRDRRGR